MEREQASVQVSVGHKARENKKELEQGNALSGDYNQELLQANQLTLQDC